MTYISVQIIPQTGINTFTVVYTEKCLPSVYQVVKQNTSYQVIPYPAPQDSVIASISMDFSCYVIIDNTNGNSKLDLIESKANDGYYVVNPPKYTSPQKGVGNKNCHVTGHVSLQKVNSVPVLWWAVLSRFYQESKESSGYRIIRGYSAQRVA